MNLQSCARMELPVSVKRVAVACSFVGAINLPALFLSCQSPLRNALLQPTAMSSGFGSALELQIRSAHVAQHETAHSGASNPSTTRDDRPQSEVCIFGPKRPPPAPFSAQQRAQTWIATSRCHSLAVRECIVSLDAWFESLFCLLRSPSCTANGALKVFDVFIAAHFDVLLLGCGIREAAAASAWWMRWMMIILRSDLFLRHRSFEACAVRLLVCVT